MARVESEASQGVRKRVPRPLVDTAEDLRDEEEERVLATQAVIVEADVRVDVPRAGRVVEGVGAVTSARNS